MLIRMAPPRKLEANVVVSALSSTLLVLLTSTATDKSTAQLPHLGSVCYILSGSATDPDRRGLYFALLDGAALRLIADTGK